jgi:4-amino-4-deoxy-L-arabinose transferase-like glycosyltransferase
VLAAALVLLLVLLALSPAYGYHRDELYFRLLPPAWGYTDQPPLTPLLVHGISSLIDQVWAVRVPAALSAAASVIVVPAITAEVGGGREAQRLAAWGYGLANFTLQLGHVMLTASLDLVVWPLVLLCVLRALVRDRGRWWLLAGLVTGLSLYNKLLIAVLLIGIVAGVLIAGPRRPRLGAWLLGALAVAVVVGLPNIVYQVANGFPQLAMGAALSAHNGWVLRPFVIPFLIALLGPTLVPVWIAGLVSLARRPDWRPIRSLAVVFAVVVVIVTLMGAQFYYNYGVLAAVYAVGCVPAVEWAARTGKRRLLTAAVGVNAAIGAVISLPVVPLPLLGRTPIPAIDQTARDQVGWPSYAKQVDRVVAAHAPGAIVLTTNYGEAGAVARFAPRLASRVYSGQNELAALRPPPASTRTVVTVGWGMEWVDRSFTRCRLAARLDSGVALRSEEEGAPVRVCTGRLAPMSVIWAHAAHLG